MNPSVGRVVVVLVVIGLTVAGLAPVLAAGAPATDVDEETAEDYDTTRFEITVHENGSATWTFSYERLLETDEDVATFEDFADHFEEESTEFYERRVAHAEDIVSSGEDVTDREMSATNFDRRAWVDHRTNPVGVIEVSFLWHGFAEQDGNDVIVQDMLSGIVLQPDQELVVVAGDGLHFASIQPEGTYGAEDLSEARSVTWTGEDHEFSSGEPYVRLTADDTGAGTWQVFAGGLAVLALIGVAVAIYKLRTRSSASPQPVGTDAAPSESDPVTPDDEELLSDEDRVVKLIQDNGGRMKQVNIVEETGWSKSKVSMLLSDMEEDGTISKLRVGRENIISLQGFEPEAAKSPHED